MTDYSLALSRDRPSHDRDAFSRRHPKMSLQNRAKIFAPFDALPDLRWKVAERQKITRPARPADRRRQRAAGPETPLAGPVLPVRSGS